MRSALLPVMRLVIMLLLMSAARADIVVSIRYFKAEGTSHHHLHLFSDKGEHLRQLTSPEDAHDMNPVFADGGKSLVFMRQKKSGDAWMEISATGGKPRALGERPGWWKAIVETNEREPKREPKRAPSEAVKRGFQDYTVYTSPVGGTKVFLHDGPTDENDPPPEAGWLVIEGKEVPISKLPGFDCYFGQTRYDGAPFLNTSAPHGVTFHGNHNSSAGTALAVIDVKAQRVLTLSENGGQLYFPPGRAGFFCVCQARYQPLPGTTKTVNCVFLDYWDPEFQRIRFADKLALFGGACFFDKTNGRFYFPE